jgi:hypothetical protein
METCEILMNAANVLLMYVTMENINEHGICLMYATMVNINICSKCIVNEAYVAKF